MKNATRSRSNRPTGPNDGPLHDLVFSDGLTITFMRTLRIPDDGSRYPLPPGLGAFPLYRAADFTTSVPEHWLSTPGENYFMPVYQREALWIRFDASRQHPFAIKVGAGNVDAITGKIWDDDIRRRIRLSKKAQNYVVVPGQHWLDGFKTEEGAIRQFVAMPLGMGYTVEGQVTGSEDFGGLQLVIVSPHRDRVRVSVDHRGEVPPSTVFGMPSPMQSPMSAQGIGQQWILSAQLAFVGSPASEMGLGMGGSMEQNVERDPHPFSMWNPRDHRLVNLWMVNSMMFRQVTGEEPPSTPVTAHEYSAHGYPWFSIYEEAARDVEPSKRLAGVKSVRKMDEAHGFGPQQDDSSISLKPGQTVKLP